uniref:Conotoxin n=1 Tax=Conus andremenezi TaxID=1077466 RepID=A0A291C248_9COND|nr:conotoxin [Conus andremenezi]
MRRLPVFIILLLLIPSAPGADVQPNTKNSVTLTSLRNFPEKTLKRLQSQTQCCIQRRSCCDD